jgi:hypothetical protein
MNEIRFEIPVIWYPGHIFLTSKLSSTARTVLDMLCIVADNYSLIILNEETVKILMILLVKCEKNFTEQTLRNSVSELYQKELLLRLKKSHYYLNPCYFLKHSLDEHRKELAGNLQRKGLFDKIECKRAMEADEKNQTPQQEVHN